MGFTDFSSDSGLAIANHFFSTRSYVEGYAPTQADVVTFKAFKIAPDATKYPHAARWYKHIASYESDFATLKGDPSRSFTSFGPESADIPVIAKKPADDDDDDMDLFGSDDEEEDPELVAQREKNLEEYRKKKAAKGKKEAETTVVLGIKPCSDQTPLRALAAEVKALLQNQEGVTYTGRSFQAIGYGIWKLLVKFDVVDEKVSIDKLQFLIQKQFGDPSEEIGGEFQDEGENEEVGRDTYGVKSAVGGVKNDIKVEDVDEVRAGEAESTDAYEEAKKARAPADEDEDGWVSSTDVVLMQKKAS
ncbi:hypothetical protein ACJ73_02568 [Blastomyces percursus]|uniref:Translation elongation factor EF1B beta/delta subunit guanine nucleotide exchange domain-containing protein n=1 Tax=Blastomyces percursus TaxID=1658174 RepID=A0A1J9REG7_9EURO|nr:hypothetical protein ACJ73_02568 [Blastomyces percursus]